MTTSGFLLRTGQRVATARRGGRANAKALYRIDDGAYTMAEITARTGLNKVRAWAVIHYARKLGRAPAWADFVAAANRSDTP